MVIWLFETFPDINFHSRHDYAFRWACGNGHIHIAIWLLENIPGIDIHFYDNSAICLACEAGHVCVAEWLYHLGHTNLRSCDDFAFKVACRNKFYHVALWILSVCAEISERIRTDFEFKWLCANKNFEEIENAIPLFN